MGLPISRHMCCSVRDKDSYGRPILPSPHFQCAEVDLAFSPHLVAFSPLWSTSTRRLALASNQTVHIYRMPDTGRFDDPTLESTLELEAGTTATALIFRDEDAARAIVIASKPSGRGAHRIRIWSCDSPGILPALGETSQFSPRALQQEGYIASLEEHAAAVMHLAVNSTYLVSFDASGECRVWQKNRSMALRATGRLHKGPVIDAAVDRHFVYSLGEEMNLSIWTTELKQVACIPMGSLEVSCLMGELTTSALSPGKQGNAGEKEPSSTFQLSRLSALKRPVSRWSGGQAASGRSTNLPRGLLFVAGVMAKDQSAAGENAAVLMEWTIGTTPFCQSAVIAHEVPIASIAYGPFDNGPLITSDVNGICRVWDCSPRLLCSQQIDALPSAGGAAPRSLKVSIATDPLNGCVYSVAGDKRLLVWSQRGSIGLPVES